MEKQYNRLEIMLKDDLKKLQNNCVCVIGIGGVGSFAIETLARCGIKKLIIVDKDIVDETNINRQLIALHSTIGQAKAKIMKERILDINPHCDVVAIEDFLNKDNISIIIAGADFVIDACDTIETKFTIIEYCLNNNIRFVCSLGAANKMDNTKVEISELFKTFNDPIAKVLRNRVKKEKLTGKIPVIFSSETPLKPQVNIAEYEYERRKDLPLLGSNAFVPSTFGITCANYCFRKLIK